MDATGDFTTYNDRPLSTATSPSSVEEVMARANELGGICIPAHVDRPSYSLLINLGFVPPGLNFPALEITSRAKPTELLRQFPELADYPLIVDGDAHRLREIKASAVFTIERRVSPGLRRPEGKEFGDHQRPPRRNPRVYGEWKASWARNPLGKALQPRRSDKTHLKEETRYGRRSP